MKYFAILFVFLSACAQQEDVCIGPDGVFVGVPYLEANTCFMTPPFLKATKLDTASLNIEQQKCGWSELLEEVQEAVGCTRKVVHKLTVTEEGYRGSIELSVTCPESRGCFALWHVDFEPYEEP